MRGNYQSENNCSYRRRGFGQQQKHGILAGSSFLTLLLFHSSQLHRQYALCLQHWQGQRDPQEWEAANGGVFVQKEIHLFQKYLFGIYGEYKMIGEKLCFAIVFAAEAMIAWLYLEYILSRKNPLPISICSFGIGYATLFAFSLLDSTTINAITF